MFNATNISKVSLNASDFAHIDHSATITSQRDNAANTYKVGEKKPVNRVASNYGP